MARFSEYLDYDILPGGVRFSGLDEYRQRPQDVINYLTEKQFKFAPTDSGTQFQTFLALQNNPLALTEKAIQLPSNFETLLSLSRSNL
jgi:hypothetical protein